MRYILVAVGRIKSGPEKQLVETYAQRLGSRLELIEVENKKTTSPAEGKRREADLIRAAIPPGAFVVALDEHGKGLTSTLFASKMAAWRDSGIPMIAFVIGGADGLDQDFLSGCDFRLAFGAMTWPHKLVRVLVAEQIYRAESIQSGHPYHRV